jgi:hypothetical protein
VGHFNGFLWFPAEENAVSCLSCGPDGTLMYESPKERQLLRRDRRPFALQLFNQPCLSVCVHIHLPPVQLVCDVDSAVKQASYN